MHKHTSPSVKVTCRRSMGTGFATTIFLYFHSKHPSIPDVEIYLYLSLCDITGRYVPHISSLAEAKFLLTWDDMVARYWILLDDSDWEIQFSDSQRNGLGQEQWFSISNSPWGALSFCSSLSPHLVDSIVLFSEQWNGLSSSSVLSGVFVLWNKWTDGSQTSTGRGG